MAIAQATLDIADILRNGSADAKIGCLTGMGEWQLARDLAALSAAAETAKWRYDNKPMRPATDEDRAKSLFELDEVPVDADEANRLFDARSEAVAALHDMYAGLRERAYEMTALHDYSPS